MLTGQKTELDEEMPEMTDIPDGIVKQRSDTIYLSGPIRKASDDGREWREEIIEEYDEFDFINPLDKYDPETHDVLNDPINFDEESEKEQVLPTEYVTQDKIGIKESSFVLVGIPEAIARGTMMETMYAYVNGIPVFVWIIDGQTESGWLYEHSKFMSDDRDEVMEEIRNYE